MPKTSLNVRLAKETYDEVKKVSDGLGINMSDLMVSSLYEFAKDEYEQADRFLKQVEDGNIVASEPGELKPMIEEFERRKRLFHNLHERYMAARAEGKKTVE